MAAVSRAQSAIADYRDVPASEEALYILVRSYEALGLTQLSEDTQRVLDASYPQSDYTRSGFKGRASPWWKLW